MVGVCITALSILKLVRPTGLGFWVNHLLAFSSLAFLASGVLSYAAMRSAQNVRLEPYADLRTGTRRGKRDLATKSGYASPL
jgi:hypothetical protein